VKFQIKHWGDRLREGDVLVSNHPQLAGGRWDMCTSTVFLCTIRVR
jgi:hypothetical protein